MDRDWFVDFHDGGAVQLLVEEFHGFRLERMRQSISILKSRKWRISMR